jgi:hypothetical protein
MRSITVRRLARAAARRIVFVHTADIVGRGINEEPPRFHTGGDFVLHRLSSMRELVLDAPKLLDGQIAELPFRIKQLNPLRVRRWRSEILTRFARGDVAYVATAQDEIASWIWLSRERVSRSSSNGLRFRLEPGQRYIYHLWASPRYRRLGAGGFVLASLLWDLYKENAELDNPHEKGLEPWVYGFIDRPNQPNLVLTKVIFGFSAIQTVRHMRLLSSIWWQIPFTDKPPSGPCSRKRRPWPGPRRDST